jgi:hypothetical protein
VTVAEMLDPASTSTYGGEMPRIDSTAPEQERVVAGRGALTLSLVAICGFFVVVMSAIALQGTPQITGEAPRLDSESITETTRPAPSSSPPPEMTPPRWSP